MKYLKIVLSLIIFSSAFIGDYVVFKSKYSDSRVFRAISDSIIHGTIGFLSASLFFSHKLNLSTQLCVLNIIFCSVISCVIDIDHVFVAKSFYLKDMTNLNQRGIFHCTTYGILITAILFTYSYVYKQFNVYILSFMVLLAFSSHHIRDGNRRGLWMYPFGHTVPINKYIYALSLSLLPNIFAILFKYIKKDCFNNTTIEYTIV